MVRRWFVVMAVLCACGGGAGKSDDGPADAPGDGAADAPGDGPPGDGGLDAIAQQAYIKASNPDFLDAFGAGIALSADGSTLAVGASSEDSSATGIGGSQTNDSAEGAGAVYVFRRTGSTWVQEAYVKSSNTGAGDEFGNSVALSADGSTLAVGAHFEDSAATMIGGDQSNNAATNAGAVYVFTRAGTTWSQQAYVKASNAGSADQFGVSVALSADGATLAVGAIAEASAATGIGGNQADNSAPGSGSVYVFARSGTTWTQQAYVKASNTDTGDRFGTSVALSADGSTLAVGAIDEASAATGVGGDQMDNSALTAGAAYVFARSGIAWAQQAYIKASNTATNDVFGLRVALSPDGNTLAVTAPYEDSSATGIGGNQADNSAGGSGAVYVFARSGVTWTQQAYVKASNTESNDNFGMAITVASDALVVGAMESSNATGINGDAGNNFAPQSGACYLFRRAAATWSQHAYIKASNTEGGDHFGESLALSADGATLVVGAPGERSGVAGINGNQADNSQPGAGAIYVFR